MTICPQAGFKLQLTPNAVGCRFKFYVNNFSVKELCKDQNEREN